MDDNDEASAPFQLTGKWKDINDSIAKIRCPAATDGFVEQVNKFNESSADEAWIKSIKTKAENNGTSEWGSSAVTTEVEKFQQQQSNSKRLLGSDFLEGLEKQKEREDCRREKMKALQPKFSRKQVKGLRDMCMCLHRGSLIDGNKRLFQEFAVVKRKRKVAKRKRKSKKGSNKTSVAAPPLTGHAISEKIVNDPQSPQGRCMIENEIHAHHNFSNNYNQQQHVYPLFRSNASNYIKF